MAMYHRVKTMIPEPLSPSAMFLAGDDDDDLPKKEILSTTIIYQPKGHNL